MSSRTIPLAVAPRVAAGASSSQREPSPAKRVRGEASAHTKKRDEDENTEYGVIQGGNDDLHLATNLPRSRPRRLLIQDIREAEEVPKRHKRAQGARSKGRTESKQDAKAPINAIKYTEYSPTQTIQSLRRSPRKRNRKDVADAEDGLASEEQHVEKVSKRRRTQARLPMVDPVRVSIPLVDRLDPMEELARTLNSPNALTEVAKKAVHVSPSVNAADERDEKSVQALLHPSDNEDDDEETANRPDEKVLDNLQLPPLQLPGDALADATTAQKTANAKSQPVLYGVKSILKMTNIFWTDPEWAIDWDWLIYDRAMDMPECRLMNQVHLLANA